MGTPDGRPPITVVISTRNRVAGAVRTLETVFENDYPFFTVILVDQSDDDRTWIAVERFAARPNFVYIRSEQRGLAVARNEGISRAGEFVAMTDDDCEVPPDWLTRFVDAFGVAPRIGVVFGNVLAGEHDPTKGFIPAYVREQPYLARRIWQKHHVEGIGACMGVRRSAWEALKGFDLSFGAGARFESAEDLDFAIRALLAGFYVYAAPEAAVVHHGFRTWQSGDSLIFGYLYGIGAMFGKLLKAGRWSLVILMWRLACRWAFAGPVANLGQTPPRMPRLLAFVRGFIAGMFTQVDRRTARCEPCDGQPDSSPLPRSVAHK